MVVFLTTVVNIEPASSYLLRLQTPLASNLTK